MGPSGHTHEAGQLSALLVSLFVCLTLSLSNKETPMRQIYLLQPSAEEVNQNGDPTNCHQDKKIWAPFGGQRSNLNRVDIKQSP